MRFIELLSDVDCHAKSAASADRIPRKDIFRITAAGEKLTAIAKWIGMIGATANRFKVSGNGAGEPTKYIRDSDARPARRPVSPKRIAKGKRSNEEPPVVRPGDLSLCPRWAALRQRILDKATM